MNSLSQYRTGRQPITNSLHKSLEEALRNVTAPEALLASLLQGKLKKRGVRLSALERQRLRDACAEMLRTGDASVLGKAVPRKRTIRIKLTERDLERLERVLAEVTETAVTTTTRKLTRSMGPHVLKWADDEVKWTASIRRGFEERLAKTWRDPLQRHARFLRVAAYIGELSMAHFREERLLESSRLANALLMLHARACSVAGEVETLIRAGYADGAAARWRTLHEIAVTGAFLVEHGEDAADRYLAHFPCEQLKGARSYEEHRRALGYEPLGARTVLRLEAQVAALKTKYGDDFRHDYGWAAHALKRQRVNFAEIEDAVKLTFMRPFYRLASEQVHASSRGAIMRSGLIEQNPTQILLVAGPSNYGFADPAMNSARALLIATVSLLQVAPTVDTNVMSMILAKWLGPLMQSFVKAQRGIEKRDNRIRERRAA